MKIRLKFIGQILLTLAITNPVAYAVNREQPPSAQTGKEGSSGQGQRKMTIEQEQEQYKREQVLRDKTLQENNAKRLQKNQMNMRN